MHIGDKIKIFRKGDGITLEKLAEKSSLSISYLSCLERNIYSPSLDTLVSLSKALNKPITSFFDEERNEKNIIRKTDRRVIVSHDKKIKMELLTETSVSNPRMSVILLTLQSNSDLTVKPRNGEESVFVLEGQIDVVIGEDRNTLAEGDSIQLDTTFNHTYKNSSFGETKLIICSSPPYLHRILKKNPEKA